MVLKRSSRVLGMIGEKNSATEGEKVDLVWLGKYGISGCRRKNY